MAPVSSVLRSIWPTVAGEDGARTAYALDAALQEVIFVGGPLLVALLATIDPAAAVAGAAVIAAVGTYAFMRLPPVRAAEPAEERHSARLGALSSVGVRTLALLSLCLGLGFGAAEIAIPAFAEAQGNRALAGVALAGFSLGSLLGGLVAALRPSRDERRRIILGTFLLAALLGSAAPRRVDGRDGRCSSSWPGFPSLRSSRRSTGRSVASRRPGRSPRRSRGSAPRSRSGSRAAALPGAG